MQERKEDNNIYITGYNMLMKCGILLKHCGNIDIVSSIDNDHKHTHHMLDILTKSPTEWDSELLEYLSTPIKPVSFCNRLLAAKPLIFYNYSN